MAFRVRRAEEEIDGAGPPVRAASPEGREDLLLLLVGSHIVLPPLPVFGWLAGPQGLLGMQEEDSRGPHPRTSPFP